MTNREVVNAIQCAFCGMVLPSWDVSHNETDCAEYLSHRVDMQKAEIEKLKKSNLGKDIEINDLKLQVKKLAIENVKLLNAPRKDKLRTYQSADVSAGD